MRYDFRVDVIPSTEPARVAMADPVIAGGPPRAAVVIRSPGPRRRAPAVIARVAVIAGLVAAAAPAAASYGGGPVPPSAGTALAYFSYGVPGGVGECSGVLVGPRTVLTAGHCVRSESSGRPFDVIGRTVFIGTPQSRAVARRVRSVAAHPRFRPRQPSTGYDLAVLRLDRSVGRAPAVLATPAEETRLAAPPARVVASGFGVVRDGQPVARRPARRVSLERLSPFNCVAPGQVPTFRRVLLCAASPTAGICAGDSGGPLSVAVPRGGTRVIGITSLGIVQSPCRSTVGVFARVVPARSWIRREIARS